MGFHPCRLGKKMIKGIREKRNKLAELVTEFRSAKPRAVNGTREKRIANFSK